MAETCRAMELPHLQTPEINSTPGMMQKPGHHQGDARGF
jgi:hypothetical protein